MFDSKSALILLLIITILALLVMSLPYFGIASHFAQLDTRLGPTPQIFEEPVLLVNGGARLNAQFGDLLAEIAKLLLAL